MASYGQNLELCQPPDCPKYALSSSCTLEKTVQSPVSAAEQKSGMATSCSFVMHGSTKGQGRPCRSKLMMQQFDVTATRWGQCSFLHQVAR